MDFCDNCGNKTEFIINNSLDLVTKCSVCIKSVEKKTDPSQHLINLFDANIEDDIDKRKLKNMSYDRTNESIEKQCPKCKNKIVKFRRSGENWKKIYGCPECNTKFTD